MDNVPSLDMFIKFNDLFSYYEDVFVVINKNIECYGLVYEEHIPKRIKGEKGNCIRKRRMFSFIIF